MFAQDCDLTSDVSQIPIAWLKDDRETTTGKKKRVGKSAAVTANRDFTKRPLPRDALHDLDDDLQGNLFPLGCFISVSPLLLKQRALW